MSQLSLRFAPPEHGWLAVELSGPGGAVSFDASGVPGDSLAMLADAACDLIDGRTPRIVTWFLEPEEYGLTFDPAGEFVDVRIRAKSRLVHLASDSPVELCRTIWRALRRLQCEPVWQRPSDEVWSHPFPTQSCKYLRRRLKT